MKNKKYHSKLNISCICVDSLHKPSMFHLYDDNTNLVKIKYPDLSEVKFSIIDIHNLTTEIGMIKGTDKFEVPKFFRKFKETKLLLAKYSLKPVFFLKLKFQFFGTMYCFYIFDIQKKNLINIGNQINRLSKNTNS